MILSSIIVVMGLFICFGSSVKKKVGVVVSSLTWGFVGGHMLFFVLLDPNREPTESKYIFWSVIIGIALAAAAYFLPRAATAFNLMSFSICLITVYDIGLSVTNSDGDTWAHVWLWSIIIIPVASIILSVKFHDKTHAIFTGILGAFIVILYFLSVRYKVDVKDIIIHIVAYLSDSYVDDFSWRIVTDTTLQEFVVTFFVSWVFLSVVGAGLQFTVSNKIREKLGISAEPERTSTNAKSAKPSKAGLFVKSIMIKYGIEKNDIIAAAIAAIGALLALNASAWAVPFEAVYIGIIVYAAYAKSKYINQFYQAAYAVSTLLLVVIMMVFKGTDSVFEEGFFVGLFAVILLGGRFILITLVMQCEYRFINVKKYMPLIMGVTGFVLYKYLLNDVSLTNILTDDDFEVYFNFVDVMSLALLMLTMYVLFKKFLDINIFNSEKMPAAFDFVNRQPKIKVTPPNVSRLSGSLASMKNVLTETSNKKFDDNLCPFCHQPTDTKMPFCGSCGASLQKKCPKCGKAADEADDIFCVVCGTELK